MNWLKTALIFSVIASVTAGCDEKEDDKNNHPQTHDIVIKFQPQFNGQDVTDWENSSISDAYGRAVDIQTFKYYLSDIRLVAGTETRSVLEADLIDHRSDPLTGTFDFYSEAEIVAGNYEALVINLGLTDDLNAIDPATYPSSSPLSAVHGMYWDWATKYIFTKTEGRIDSDGDGTPDQSWFIHSGMNELLKKDIEIMRSFNVPEQDTLTVLVNLNAFFIQNNDTSDLVLNGQSHTTDNMELATDFTNQIADAFE